jgi:hypothetical protein
MNDPTPGTPEPRPARAQEYEDPHYHDDDDSPTEEGARLRHPAERRRSQRKWPAQRRYED